MSHATTDTNATAGNASTSGPTGKGGGFKRSNTASAGDGTSKTSGGNNAAKTVFPPVSRRPVFCCYDHAFVVDGKHYKAGVYYHHLAPVKDDNGKIVGKEPEELWICSILKVDSIVRTPDGNEHSYLLRFVPHGKSALHTTVLSQSLLLSRPEDAFRELRSIGVSVLARHVKLVREYLDTQHLRFGVHTPESFAELAKVVGWHGLKTFVLPGKIIGDEKHSRVWFSDTGEAANYSSGGTSEGWKTNVAGLAPGNDYLVFGISFGFAGPLLEHLNLPGVAAHLYGDSTGGKTSIQFAAGSVWGPRSFTSTWAGSVNGLEGHAASRSGTLMVLDELQLCEPKHLAAGIYLLLGGMSKNRMNRDTTVRWQIALLSSGESSSRAYLTTKTTEHKSGQAVRLVDVPVSATYGAFDNLHGSKGGKEFAERLTAAAAADYGFAGPEFVEWLITNLPKIDLAPLLEEASNTVIEKGDEASNTVTEKSDRLSAQDQRVARMFAVIGMAGELAIQSKILSWEKGTALIASKSLFNHWKKANPASGKVREHTLILKKVADYLETYGSSRFSDIDWTPGSNQYGIQEKAPLVNVRSGYWEDEGGGCRIFLFSSVGLREATAGFDFTRVIRALDEAKAFDSTETGGNVKSRLRRVKGENRRDRFYHINPEALSTAEEE